MAYAVDRRTGVWYRHVVLSSNMFFFSFLVWVSNLAWAHRAKVEVIKLYCNYTCKTFVCIRITQRDHSTKKPQTLRQLVITSLGRRSLYIKGGIEL